MPVIYRTSTDPDLGGSNVEDVTEDPSLKEEWDADTQPYRWNKEDAVATFRPYRPSGNGKQAEQ